MRWMITGPGLAALGAVLLLVGTFGTRAGAWSFVVGFLRLALGVVLASCGILASVVSLVRGGPWVVSMLGVVLGAAVLAGPMLAVLSGRGAPAINDITTDPEDPPSFSAVLPLRGPGAGPATYGGEEVAEAQRRAYPDIGPLTVALPPDETFIKALEVARSQGWGVVASDTAAGRIEAVDTTFWFGFQDDVVIRIRPQGGESRVDIRSKSRVGRGDLGANARRIRRFLSALRAAAGVPLAQ